MNQNVIFVDQETWNGERQAVLFMAQQGGALIPCWVALEWLQNHSDARLEEEAQILLCFSQSRFDLEDLAETAIDNESFNDQGEIIIN